MPLFPSKPYGQLTWEDVKQFLDRRVPENELLDYKERMPQKPLEITIAAMANTYGGDILLGVGKDKNNPNLPQPAGQVRGLANAMKVQTQIEDLNLTIQPPVLGVSPQVVDIPPDAHPDRCEDHSIVIVRIGQSDLTPHFVPGWGHYGRAGARNQPYKDVPLETGKIEWLLERRRRHVEFREDLLRFADAIHPAQVWHKVWCAPMFPSAPLWRGASSEEILQGCSWLKTRYREKVFFEHGFPVDSTRLRPVQHGWMWSRDWNSGVTAFRVRLEGGIKEPQSPFCMYLVDDRGVLFYKGITGPELTCMQAVESLPDSGTGRRSPAVRFDLATVTLKLIGICEHAATLYEKFGYNGPVQFGLEAGVDASTYHGRALLGATLFQSHHDDWAFGVRKLPPGDPGMVAPDMKVNDFDECVAGELRQQVRLSALHGRWVRAFGHEPSQDDADLILAASRLLVKGED